MLVQLQGCFVVLGWFRFSHLRQNTDLVTHRNHPVSIVVEKNKQKIILIQVTVQENNQTDLVSLIHRNGFGISEVIHHSDC